MKKLRVLSAAFLAAMTLGLASCDVDMDMTAADRAVAVVNDVNVYDNNLGAIYDEVVVSGDTNSEKILDNILYIYAKAMFGNFYEDYEADGTLKADVKPKAFTSTDGTVDSKRAKDFYNTIVESILKSFWGYVNDSTYQENKCFSEKLFVKTQKADLYDINDSAVTYATYPLVGDETYKDTLSYFHNHDFASFRTFYKDYIERALLANAYRKSLVEEYLIDFNYGTLGRSYARKIQYVALPNLDKFEDSTRALVRTYCEAVLSRSDKELNDNYGAGVASVAKDLGFLDTLYQGYIASPRIEESQVEALEHLAEDIYGIAGFTSVTTTSGTVYKETVYGQLCLDYDRLSDSRWESGTTTDFTNSGAYSEATGLQMKTRDIIATSKTTSGWYTSSGLSDLPSSMKTRLFKTQVANEVDDPTDNYTEEHPVTDVVKGKYVWRVQGQYYLRPETIQTGEQYPYAMYDDSSKTWYIIRVDEAVKSAKLTEDGDDSSTSYSKREDSAYAGKIRTGETLDQIVYDVADLIADGDSYKKAARQYYVEQMAMAFHDDTVYSYFESTFPDLFD